jgi:hypothetical protein
MMLWEIAQPTLFPPVARFFIALLLILVVEGSAILFAFWVYSKYGEDE